MQPRAAPEPPALRDGSPVEGAAVLLSTPHSPHIMIVTVQ